VKAIVSFHDGQIIEIVVTFGETYWDEVLPILVRNMKVAGRLSVKIQS
jgi:hypothetical protein